MCRRGIREILPCLFNPASLTNTTHVTTNPAPPNSQTQKPYFPAPLNSFTEEQLSRASAVADGILLFQLLAYLPPSILSKPLIFPLGDAADDTLEPSPQPSPPADAGSDDDIILPTTVKVLKFCPTAALMHRCIDASYKLLFTVLNHA